MMKHMEIFEQAMCCPTGLCGPSIDPELLRVSTVLDTLKQHGIDVGRYNLTSAPLKFVQTKAVTDSSSTTARKTCPHPRRRRRPVCRPLSDE